MNSIKHIRKTVFRLNQADFAALAGVTQATVSRWESGGTPTLSELHAIREAAAERKIRWQDKWFFEAPLSHPEQAA